MSTWKGLRTEPVTAVAVYKDGERVGIMFPCTGGWVAYNLGPEQKTEPEAQDLAETLWG